MFDDFWGRGAVVKNSLYQPKGPLPVFLRNGKHAVVDDLDAMLLRAKPEWRYRFRARATAVVVTSLCHHFLSTPDELEGTIHEMAITPSNEIKSWKRRKGPRIYFGIFSRMIS